MTATLVHTPIYQAITAYEERTCLKFSPDERFYKKVGINQKRFGMLTRGELRLFVFEAKNLSEFFGIELNELIN